MTDFITSWHQAFSDPSGGFYERLDENLKPFDLPKRLLAQCRQIYVYAKAGRNMSEPFEWMIKHYRDPNGGWRFSSNDTHYDLYAHAFVLLTCSAVKRPDIALPTLRFVRNHFDMTGTAQNPYMHLLEGCLAMAEISDDPLFRATAQDMLKLFEGRFFNGQVVLEQVGSDRVEAGHQSEWVWLLDWYEKIFGSDLSATRTKLFDWVREHGMDMQYGGIFNAQKPDGAVTDDKKRIWPVCETIRAARLMGDKTRAGQLENVIHKHYLRPDGFWTEVLNRDLTPSITYLPGTTPYHLYPILKAD